MARFFFDVEDGELVTDDEGAELRDIDAAKRAGAQLLGELMKSHPQRIWETETFRITCRDARGLLLFQMQALWLPAPAICS